MSLSAQNVLTGLGVTAAVSALVFFLRRSGAFLDRPVASLTFECGFLTSRSLLQLIEEMKQRCQIELRKLRLACAEERLKARGRSDEYYKVVETYLQKEREALAEAMQAILNIYGVQKSVFEESIRRNLQAEDAAALLSSKMHIGMDSMGAVVPARLTKEVYCEVLQEMAQMIEAVKAKPPVEPLELVVLLMKINDDLAARYGFTEFELAAAGQTYSCSQTAVLNERTQKAVARLTNPRRINAF